MKYSSLRVVLYCIFFCCSACGIPVSEDDPELQNIYGVWRWTGSSGGFTGDRYEPGPETGNVFVVFKREHRYAHYRNDELGEEGVFSLGYDDDLNRANVTYKNGGYVRTQWYYFTGSCTLTLIDQGADGFVSAYVKISD